MQRKVAIIGGGITGLTAGYYLQKEIEEGQAITATLFESEKVLGGKMQTVVKDGFVIEKGPDSYLARKTIATEIIKELGLEHLLVSNETGKSYVLAKGRLHSMPGGAVMGIPTQLKPFAFSSLFSPIGKMRAAFDFVLPRTKMNGDMALGTFFRRRVGDEVVDNLIEPLLSGIYAGDIDKMSLMATFPNFYEVEQKYGGLVKGMKKVTPKQKPDAEKKEKVGMFRTLKTGLGTITDALEKRLHNVEIQKNVKVLQISKSMNGYELLLSTKETIQFDDVIVCTPHRVTYEMLKQYKPFEFFKEQPSTSVANVAMSFPLEAILDDIDGTGFVISRKYDSAITACTWTHKKWPHTTPEGKALLRCYVGKPGDAEIIDKSDEEIIETVLSDLKKIMNISSPPEFSVVSRWKEAMPQYTVGHVERLKQLKTYMSKELPNVYLAGGSYEGLGLPDCMNQGKACAEKIVESLNKNEVVFS